MLNAQRLIHDCEFDIYMLADGCLFSPSSPPKEAAALNFCASDWWYLLIFRLLLLAASLLLFMPLLCEITRRFS